MVDVYMPFIIFFMALSFALLIYDMWRRGKVQDLFIDKKGRKCLVYEDRGRDGEGEQAIFHKFVQDHMRDRKGELVYFPAAIVEFENGALETVPVEHIIMKKE